MLIRFFWSYQQIIFYNFRLPYLSKLKYNEDYINTLPANNKKENSKYIFLREKQNEAFANMTPHSRESTVLYYAKTTNKTFLENLK